jgi:hypothetical protein
MAPASLARRAKGTRGRGTTAAARLDKGRPQEREHSDAEGGTRDRAPPPSGSLYLCEGWEPEGPSPFPALGSSWLGMRQPVRRSRTHP